MNRKISFNKTLISIGCLFLCALSFISTASEVKLTQAINTQNLVILQYHHVSTKTPNSTSVSPSVFESHMALLSENFHVVDLAEAIDKIQSRQALPNRSVAITFDDGFRNILENGHPILEKYGFPYTIFINPALIGESSHQLTWEQVKQMQPLATFANHTLDHAHLLTKSESEKSSSWLLRVMKDINQAEEIIETKLGYSKKWLAYPFGEFNLVLKEELQSQGYIGFGQQSGAVSVFSDFGALPRFPAAGVYANLDSLKTKINSFAMPVKTVFPLDNQFQVGDSLDFIELRVEDQDVRLTAIACYFKGTTLPIKKDADKLIIEVNHVFMPGRARINCTAPSNQFSGRFYWYSYPMFTANQKGEFLD
ncbi:MAG: peptidoglycan/xylan/chitin deacetylase (PgdA/CDA1 family) [Alphaproteobacteria bacterium]|jgi:peptidoglycan/xylan/chitin deacetylase (PgdA/CDA1 family)